MHQPAHQTQPRRDEADGPARRGDGRAAAPRALWLFAALSALLLAACAPGADGPLGSATGGAATAAAQQDDGRSDEERLLAMINEKRVAGTVCSGIDRPARAALTLDPRLSRVAQLHAELPPEQVGEERANLQAVVDGLYAEGYDHLYASPLLVDADEAAEVAALFRLLDRGHASACIYFTSVQVSQVALGRGADRWVVLVADEAEPGEAQRDLLDAFNRRRSEGLTCPHSGAHGPAPALRLSPELNAVAQAQAERMHAMGAAGGDDGGPSAAERIDAAGYPPESLRGALAGRFYGHQEVVERVVSGEELVDLGSWCTILMDPEVVEIGYGKAGSHSELLFAAPR